MQRNINKLSSNAIQDFLLRSNTGNIEKKVENGFSVISQDLFANLEDRKRVIAFLKSEGHDVFKRGTKEPRAIEITLSNTQWETVKAIDPAAAGVRSMFD